MINLSQATWLQQPACQAVMKALSAGGNTPRFVGGCVRDTIAGREVHDIDIATPDLPETVISLLETENIKAIPTGIEHGTITALCEGQTFEITTLRADVENDGRRAVVAFSEDWLVDAQRRDFTINTISVDLAGKIYDPFKGIEDLKAGRVRFVGDAAERIKEDYLRLLRFFRFSAYFSKMGPDAEALAACSGLASGLETLSGERIAHEFLRLLASPHPAKWISVMMKQGVQAHLFKTVRDVMALEMLCAFEDKPDGLRRLAAILPDIEDDVQACSNRLRLSKAQTKRLMLARCAKEKITPYMAEDDSRAFLYRYGAVAARDQLLLFWAEKGFTGIGPTEQNLLTLLDEWQKTPVVFPVQGRDLLTFGFQAGPDLGQALKTVENWWCDGGCKANKERCLEHLSSLNLILH